MAQVVRELCDYFQCECKEGEALPDNVFHDVILQVHVHVLHAFSFLIFTQN